MSCGREASQTSLTFLSAVLIIIVIATESYMSYVPCLLTAPTDRAATLSAEKQRLATVSRGDAGWSATAKKSSSCTLMALTLAACGGGGNSGGDSGDVGCYGRSNNVYFE